MHAAFGWLVEPGFFSSAPVRTAALVGGVAAVVSGIVGAFTVMRGQSFAGHALADVSAAGGSAAFLIGISPLLGFVGMAGLAAGGMEAVGVERARGRDLATGIVLGAGLGLAALLLYFDSTSTSTTGAAISVLFGSMFAIAPSIIPWAAGLSALVALAVLLAYRPLLLSSLDPDLAAVRGVRVRVFETLHLLALAAAVALSALTIGAILSTALLVGPGAAALRVARRPGWSLVWAAGIGLGCTWLGILLAYDSYDWPPGHRGWPVSFFIVALVFVAYVAGGIFHRVRRDRRDHRDRRGTSARQAHATAGSA
ncbi:MAG: metal ABC transporter permease [Actinomycetota bacterium]|nr:metal ABC transporter permease [Actinomycetota bacterium]